MKRFTAVAAIIAASTLGAVGIADTTPEEAAHLTFGDLTDVLLLDDVWVDAERTFAKIDVDADGVIDADEYAAQALAYASLVRLAGLVTVDGREEIHVGLPQKGEATLSAAERSAIDAVARARFHQVSAASEGITPRRWVKLRVERFGAADRNGDGRLTGRELGHYAMAFAQYEPRRGPFA